MIEIDIKIQAVEASLEQIKEKLAHREPLMRKLAGDLLFAVDQNFAQGGRPKWQGLKYRAGQPLINSGLLRNSLRPYSDNEQALVGTNLIYAPLHHFGGKAGRGRKVTIPARPFMTLTPDDEADLVETVQEYFRTL